MKIVLLLSALSLLVLIPISYADTFNLNATATSKDTVLLEWDEMDATHYWTYYKLPEHWYWTPHVTASDITTTSESIYYLNANTTYAFKVFARDNGGTFAISNYVNATTLATP